MDKRQESVARGSPPLFSSRSPVMAEDELYRLQSLPFAGNQSQPDNVPDGGHTEPARMEAANESELSTFLVTINISKTIRPRVKAILALPSKNGGAPKIPVLDSQSHSESIESAAESESGEKHAWDKAALGGHSTDEWHKYRKTILGLFDDPSKNLIEVRRIMKEEYGFDKSIRAYRYRLEEWRRMPLAKSQAHTHPGHTAQALGSDARPISPLQHATLQPHPSWEVGRKWLWIETPGGTTELVEVMWDCASTGNFVAASEARRLGLQLKPVAEPAPAFELAVGQFVPEEYVDISWVSQGHSKPTSTFSPHDGLGFVPVPVEYSRIPRLPPKSPRDRLLPSNVSHTQGKLPSSDSIIEASPDEHVFPKIGNFFRSTDRFYVSPPQAIFKMLVGTEFIIQYPGALVDEEPGGPVPDRMLQVISQDSNAKSSSIPPPLSSAANESVGSPPLDEQHTTQDEQQKFANRLLQSKNTTSHISNVQDVPGPGGFLCPYVAHNPAVYKECLQYTLRRIRDVKQHLARHHRIPLHCPRCGLTFELEEDRDVHIMVFICKHKAEVKFDGMKESQKLAISKKSASRDTATQWYEIFDILFPGQIRPASPHMDQVLSEEPQTSHEGIPPGLPTDFSVELEIPKATFDIERQFELINSPLNTPQSDQGNAQMSVQDKARFQQYEGSIVSYSASKTSGGTQQSKTSTGDRQEKSTDITEHSDAKSGCENVQHQESRHEGLGLYGTSTEYSASELSKASAPHNEQYIIDLATDLYNSIKRHDLGKELLTRISGILPNLLRAFAVKVGHNTRTQTPRDVSYFVHKYRRRIQSAFQDLFLLEHAATRNATDAVQNGEFALGRFLEEPDIVGEFVDLVPSYPESEPDVPAITDGLEEQKDGHIYRDFILGTPEYQWLVKTLQRESVSRRASPDILERIGAEILAGLPSSHHVSRSAPSQRYEISFDLDWNPLDFIDQQSYTGASDLGRAITITGSASDAQAVTTAEYLVQTWPTGGQIMQLIEEVASHGPYYSVTCTLPDRTELRAHLQDNRFIVLATGPGDSVVEVGQQFAWVGAALRSSTSATGIATCTPFVSSTSLKTADPSDPEPIPSITCVLGFDLQPPAAEATENHGKCWHNMFRNPVMVIGFPIPFKSDDHTLGLEMPLNMISTLAGSNRVHEFDGKVFIKGFSTMTIATKKTGDLVVWHYFYNTDGRKLSHLDHTLGDELNGTISLLQLENYRHVVGWCSDCKIYAGSKDARQDVNSAKDLPPPSSGCRLEKFTLSGGKFITAGVTFAAATKDKPTHLTMKGYIEKLKSIDEKYVVFWDESDKRGWLVNGTSALLHLVRASLYHRSRDKFSRVFRWRQSDMNEYHSAVEVLIDEANRELEIYADKPTVSGEDEWKRESSNDTKESTARKRRWDYFTFQDLVEQLYHFLDEIIDYQARAEQSDGIELKKDFRKRLEGWDFVELAKATSTNISPRVARLEALGWGWVDFIRSIGAVTLFGHGFGEIIQPEPFEGMCPKWCSLPKAKYYLAVSGLDLQNVKFDPGRLVWHSPANPIAPCRCQGRSAHLHTLGSSHHDPVQVFYPKMSRFILPINTPDMTRIHTKGAYVFGYNITWPYRWRPGKHKDGEDIEESSASSASGERIPSISVEPYSQSSTPEIGSYAVTPSAQSERSSTTDAIMHPSLPSATLTIPTSVDTDPHLPYRSKRTLPTDTSTDCQADHTFGGSSNGGEAADGQERRAKRRKQREAHERRA